jgi:diguanylate cyclase (GGDEF)-like protein/PAS domain S-box-containing protein
MYFMPNSSSTKKSPSKKVNAKILVIDDAQVNLRMLTQCLATEGYAVQAVPDGKRALEAVLSNQPDLILLDIVMPDLDGFEVCRILKENDQTKTIPVLFMSALNETEDKVKGFEAGAVDYITKPFQFQEVLARVQTHLTLRNLQKELEAANRTLEERVDERTKALTKANQALEKEVNERKMIGKALQLSEERYVLAIQGSNDGLWDWDITTDEVYLSPRWKAILGYKPEEIDNTTDEWFNRVHPDDLARFRMSIFNHQEALTPHLEEEYRMLHRDGTYRYVCTRGLAVRNPEGKAYRMAGSQTDISYRKRIEEQLHHDAYYDPLTALPNRAMFMERVSSALALCRQRADYGFTVITMDVDHFKSVNESMGHKYGDLLLAEISWKLKSLMRPIDTIARIGEDEFGILLENITDAAAIAALTNEISSTFSSPLDLEGNPLSISVRVGTTVYTPGEGETPSERCEATTDDILRAASLAMQQNKNQQ